MNTIFKYELMTSMGFMLFHGRGDGAVSDPLPIIMPVGARVLHADVQYGTPVVWAMVTVTGPNMERRFRLVYTGADLPPDVDPDRHIATMHANGLVVHLFEVT